MDRTLHYCFEVVHVSIVPSSDDQRAYLSLSVYFDELLAELNPCFRFPRIIMEIASTFVCSNGENINRM